MPSARALRFGKAVIELSLLTGPIEKQLKTLESRMKNFGTALKSIGSTGLKASAGLGGLLAFPIKLAADMEKTRAEFRALIGDAGKADSVISQLEGFALVTPLSVQDLSAATRTMLGFGVSVDAVVPTLKRLGEIAGGDGERMQRLALAFGQVTAKGRLMAQEVNQMVESGFNPLQEISRTTGRSMNDLMKEMEGGNISVDMVAEAFRTATSDGGKFKGLLAEISGTTIGQINELKESFLLAIRPLGEAMLPAVKDLLIQAQELVGPLAEWAKQNGEIAVSLGKIVLVAVPASAAIIAIGVVAKNAAALVAGLRIALVALAANPIVAAILAAGLAINAVAEYIEQVAKNVERVNMAAMATPAVKPGQYKPQKTGVLPWNKPKSGPAEPGFTSGQNAPAKFFGDRLRQQIEDQLKAWGDIAEKRRAAFDESTQLDDDLARAKIDAMEDEHARQVAMIELEKRIRMRALQEQGILTPEIQAKLDALEKSQIAGVDETKKVDGRSHSVDGIFDTRFASQIFGGPRDEELIALKQIARNTKPKPAAAGAIVVVP